MAVIFSKSSGLNDNVWKGVDRALMAVMQDVDNEKNKDDELVRALYNERKSDKFGEKTTGLTGFSNFELVEEGGSAPLDDVQEGYDKLVVHKQFMKKFVSTAEMVEDAQIDVLRTASANFIRAYKRSRAEFASKALTCQGQEFVYGTTSIDRTTGDGEGLFSTGHKSKKISGQTQSNVFKTALGADTTTLYRLSNIGRNFKNDSGQPMGYTFDTIVIPANVPEMEEFIKRVIRSDLLVGSTHNDVNTQKGLWNLVVDHHWQAAEGKEPFILLSTEANRELLGSLFYERVGLKVINEIDLDTHNLEWSGRSRFSAGFGNWRHVIMGGADAGTELN